MTGGRKTKKQIQALLSSDAWEAALPSIAKLGPQALAPLFSALCASKPLLRWHAVTAFGLVVADMAGKTPEKARVVMRRFIWSLNDESGGIGWGAPEAMAEIMTQSPLMAAEYHNHLLSYIHEDHCRPDCYLEHAPLRRGAFWGIGRLGQVRPDLVRRAEADILCALTDCDPPIRGLAAWVCGTLHLKSALNLLKNLGADQTSVELYCERILLETTPAQLAGEAIHRITDLSPATH